MIRSKWIILSAVALLVVTGALAATAQTQQTPSKKGNGSGKKPPAPVTISAGDDGWTTPSDGKTWVDLKSLPIVKLFGGPVKGSTRVALKGKPLSAYLGGIDTLLHRSE